MHRYRQPVFRLARACLGDADEALDLTQETFVAAHQALPRYDAARPMRAWLSTIVINKCRDHARKRAVRRFFSFASPIGSEAEAVAPLLSRSVAGLVVATGTAGAPLGFLEQVAHDLPVVQVDAAGPSAVSDAVGIDNVHAGRLLTEHVLASGHREVLFVGSGPAASTEPTRLRWISCHGVCDVG